jgi:hypothetical protein
MIIGAMVAALFTAGPVGLAMAAIPTLHRSPGLL